MSACNLRSPYSRDGCCRGRGTRRRTKLALIVASMRCRSLSITIGLTYDQSVLDPSLQMIVKETETQVGNTTNSPPSTTSRVLSLQTGRIPAPAPRKHFACSKNSSDFCVTYPRTTRPASVTSSMSFTWCSPSTSLQSTSTPRACSRF